MLDMTSYILGRKSGGSGGGSGGGGDLVPIVIRPDAELVQKWEYDKLLVEDEGVTIPSYTIQRTTLVPSETFTVNRTSEDVDTYDYFWASRGLVIPFYNTDAKGRGRQEYSIQESFYEYGSIRDKFPAILDGTLPTGRYNINGGYGYALFMYWDHAPAYKVASNVSYGAKLSSVSSQTSGTNIIFTTGDCAITGSSTYLSETFFNAITDIRVQQVIEIWRVKKEGKSTDGWASLQNVLRIADCVASPTHKLT